MNFLVAIIKPCQIGHGKIVVLDLQNAVRIRAGETDAAAISQPAPSPLWTGATP
jgi:nitrogen regulatory protein PII